MTLGALVDDRDLQAAREEGGLAQTLLERVEVEVERLEDVGVGQEGDGRARGRAGGQLLAALELLLRGAARILLREDVAVAADLHQQALRQRVDDRDADPVQATGDLVATAVSELAAGVQDGQHDLDRRTALLLHASPRGCRGRCRPR